MILNPKEVPSPPTIMQMPKGFAFSWPALAPVSSELIPFMNCLTVLGQSNWGTQLDLYRLRARAHAHTSILARHVCI